MAETPKGDTATPTDAPTGTPTGGAEPIPVAGDTIAGDTGGDSLAVGTGEPEVPPLSATRAADKAAPAAAAAPPARTGGGGRRLLILVVLLVAAGGAGYATYPVWRGQLAPYAARLGVELPGMRTAEVPPPAAAPAPAPTPAPAPAPAAQPAPTPPAATGPVLAGDIDRLADRLNALEQRVAAVEARPVAEPPAAPAAAPADAAAALGERLDALAEKLAAVTDEVAIVREGLAGSGGGEGLGPMAAKLSERLQGLTDRIAAIEERPQAAPDLAGRVAALEQRPTPAAVAPERLEAMQNRVDGVSGRLDEEVRKSAEDVIRLETRLGSIDGRLAELAKSLAATRGSREKAGAFLLAANQLAAAAATSGGFGAELGAVRAAAPADPAVAAALEALAARAGGVPSLAVLRDHFARTATAAVDASVVGSGEGVIGQALTRVASLVTIRRTATDADDSLDGMLLRAEAALAAGDLPGAIAAVRRLDGDPAKAAAGWLADAEARAAVDAAVRAVQAKSLAGVAGG